MKGLCHVCNSSNVDVTVEEDIVICKNCQDKTGS